MTEKKQALYDIFGFNPNRVDYLINISNKHKYIYFETPKVGCSTIKKTLQKLEVDDLSKMPEDVHNKSSSPLLSPLKLEKNFTEYLNDEYFKFSFVRNPYTRILSCYLDKIVGIQKDVVLPQLGFEATDNVSFKDFLLAVKKQSYAEMNPHWKPQSNLLAAGKITLDFIGRQEDFDNDLQKVLSKITKSDTDSNKILNEMPHAVGANKKLQKYITKDIAKLIQEIYHDDFHLYGYSADPFNTDPFPTISENLLDNSDAKELVSIVIPCYNQAQHLEEAVVSAINQTYSNIEIIIVNDGSLDNTEEVAIKLKNEHPEIIRLVSQDNLGLSEARNRGIKESLGEYILPLDADDKIAASMISKSLKVMIHDDIDIVSTDTQCFGKETYKIIPIDSLECNLLYGNCWIGNSLFRRKVWVDIGGYKQNMLGGYEDWEFWINAYKHGFKFKRYPEVLFYYRTKEESMFITAQNKDKYLKSKIVVNNPELYIAPHVQEAISVIKETEELADLYFYYDKKMSANEDVLIREVGEFFYNNQIEQKHIVQVDGHKIGLCDLDIVENNESLEKIYEEMDVPFILFFAPIRYEVEELQTSDYAWKKEKGVVKAYGTLFPFVFKFKRENPKSQLIAYKRLVKFQDKNLNMQKMHILKSKEHKDAIIEKYNKEISQNNHRLKMLLDAIEKVTTFSIKKNPILKYKAYKMILKVYYQLREFKK